MIFLVIGGEGALLRDILAATPMLQGWNSKHEMQPWRSGDF
jgi:hypothetical protein